MIVSFICPHCQTRIEADAEAGPQVMCAACKCLTEVPPPHVAPNTVIGGYRLIRRIGRGGMGDVYFAFQLSLKREAALKILHPTLSRDPVFVSRFLRETHLVARLDHPYIVKAFNSGEDMGFHYLAMAYVDGSPLDRRIRQRPLPETDALKMALGIAQALDYAWNEHHLIHRDLKPANIMLEKNGSVRLMDFGISLSLLDSHARVTRPGLLVGTPNYMSPEALVGQADLDFRSDVYALGATLYHALTGRLPYAGRNLAETLRQRGDNTPLPHPQDENPSLSEPCVALLTRMLDPVPERRSSSWAETAEDIQRVIFGEMPRHTRESDSARHSSAPITTALRRSSFATHVLSRRRRIMIGVLLTIASALFVLDVWLILRLILRR